MFFSLHLSGVLTIPVLTIHVHFTFTKTNTFLCAVVGFESIVYTVIEGNDSFVRLTVFRTGNTDLSGNVSFSTAPGTADGKRFNKLTLSYACMPLTIHIPFTMGVRNG